MSNKGELSGMAGMRIGLLGAFRVSVGPREIPDSAWRGYQAPSVFKLLALAPGHSLHRDQVVEWLWPERKPANLANSLHQAIYAVRRILEPALAQSDPSTYIRVRGEVLALTTPDGLWIDVDAFTGAAAVARRAGTGIAYQAALDLYVGDLLPGDLYADWAANRREELQALYLSLLADQALLYEQAGQEEQAIRALKQLVDAEPTDEAAHVGLMRLYARSGREAQALGQYHRLEEALRREFDAATGAESRRLFRDIAEGRYASGSGGAAGRGTPATQGHGDTSGPVPVEWPATLPVPPTGFVGRERELAGIIGRLSSVRLLTLTGAGGCGKTRLALQAAATVHRAYADGVRLVELAALVDGTLVAQALAAALGIQTSDDRAPLETVVEGLGTRQMLVILDNCEHLAGACAALVEWLLPACPRLRLLATCREPLDAAGETVWQVPPMAWPAADDLPSVDDLLGYDALLLFMERARARRPGFGLTQQHAAPVAQICRRLDGIPLAIELAAARVNILSAQEIADRLDDILALLVHHDQPILPHHRTLRAAIEWSHELLSEPERALFRRLSIFAGGWTPDAAENVCGDDELEARSVLELLSQLVDRSLVVAQEQNGRMRCRMLEAIRQYGIDRLVEAGEAPRLHLRHGAWCVALAEQALPELTGPNQAIWLDRLEDEHDNLRAALREAVRTDDVETTLRLGAALWRFWFQHGHAREGRIWLEQALDLDPGGGRVDAMLRARALSALGSLVWPQGEYTRARVLFEESVELRRPLGDLHGVAACLNNLGNVAQYQGDYTQAAIYHEQSLGISRQLDDTWGIAGSLTNLAVIAAEQGAYARSITLLEESLALRRQLGDLAAVALTLGNLGVLARYQGAHARAEALLEESLELRRRLNDRWGMGSALANLGSIACDRHRYERALALFAESLTLCRETNDRRVAAYCLEGFARLALIQGQPRRGVRLAAAATVVRDEIKAHLPAIERAALERTLAAARQMLGEEVYAAASTAGRALSLDQSIADALNPGAPERADSDTRSPGFELDRVASLTARELEIAALIAIRHTNRQIAENLDIGLRTITTHVSNILAKLGYTDRAQIGDWYASQGCAT